MKACLAVVATLAASAAGFQLPGQLARPSSALKASSTTTSNPSLEEIGGYGVETGNKPFDPLNIAQWAPVDRLRSSELANGRTAMLAVVGWIVPEIFGKFASDDVTSTHALDALQQASPEWWLQFLLLCGAIELATFKHYTVNQSKRPAFDPLNLYPKDDAGKKAMDLKELKNGRGAMIAFAALVSHELIPGSVPIWPFPF